MTAHAVLFFLSSLLGLGFTYPYCRSSSESLYYLKLYPMPTFDKFVADRSLEDLAIAEQLFYYQEFCDDYYNVLTFTENN